MSEILIVWLWAWGAIERFKSLYNDAPNWMVLISALFWPISVPLGHAYLFWMWL